MLGSSVPKAAAIPARKIRRALGPELVDVVVGMEAAVEAQSRRLTVLTSRSQSLSDRLATIEALPVLPVGLAFLARLRWIVTGAMQ